MQLREECAADRIRTGDLAINSRVLPPTELRRHIWNLSECSIDLSIAI